MKAFQNPLSFNKWNVYTKCNCKKYGASPSQTCKDRGHYSTTLIAESAKHAVEIYKTFKFLPQEGGGPVDTQWPQM